VLSSPRQWLSFINSTSWSPLTGQATLFNGLGSTTTGAGTYDGDQLIVTIPEQQVVDLVVNNYDDGDHPFRALGPRKGGKINLSLTTLFRARSSWAQGLCDGNWSGTVSRSSPQRDEPAPVRSSRRSRGRRLTLAWFADETPFSSLRTPGLFFVLLRIIVCLSCSSLTVTAALTDVLPLNSGDV
jgi:hypothetical protein